MSLVPRDMFRNWWDDIDRYHRDLEEHFRRVTLRDSTWKSFSLPSFRDFHRPWRSVFERLDQQVDGWTNIVSDEDKYRIIVDVQQFSPEEIIVRTDDKSITIEGRHEEKNDYNGYVSRHFYRRYTIPQGYDIGHVRPSLSSDGILTVTAPRQALPAPWERIVPIQRTYRPAIKAS